MGKYGSRHSEGFRENPEMVHIHALFSLSIFTKPLQAQMTVHWSEVKKGISWAQSYPLKRMV